MIHISYRFKYFWARDESFSLSPLHLYWDFQLFLPTNIFPKTTENHEIKQIIRPENIGKNVVKQAMRCDHPAHLALASVVRERANILVRSDHVSTDWLVMSGFAQFECRNWHLNR